MQQSANPGAQAQGPAVPQQALAATSALPPAAAPPPCRLPPLTAPGSAPVVTGGGRHVCAACRHDVLPRRAAAGTAASGQVLQHRCGVRGHWHGCVGSLPCGTAGGGTSEFAGVPSPNALQLWKPGVRCVVDRLVTALPQLVQPYSHPLCWFAISACLPLAVLPPRQTTTRVRWPRSPLWTTTSASWPTCTTSPSTRWCPT